MAAAALVPAFPVAFVSDRQTYRPVKQEEDNEDYERIKNESYQC